VGPEQPEHPAPRDAVNPPFVMVLGVMVLGDGPADLILASPPSQDRCRQTRVAYELPHRVRARLRGRCPPELREEVVAIAQRALGSHNPT
jgi:hypothetical protein